jgi:hypothetical protein
MSRRASTSVRSPSDAKSARCARSTAHDDAAACDSRSNITLSAPLQYSTSRPEGARTTTLWRFLRHECIDSAMMTATTSPIMHTTTTMVLLPTNKGYSKERARRRRREETIEQAREARQLQSVPHACTHTHTTAHLLELNSFTASIV